MSTQNKCSIKDFQISFLTIASSQMHTNCIILSLLCSHYFFSVSWTQGFLVFSISGARSSWSFLLPCYTPCSNFPSFFSVYRCQSPESPSGLFRLRFRCIGASFWDESYHLYGEDSWVMMIQGCGHLTMRQVWGEVEGRYPVETCPEVIALE